MVLSRDGIRKRGNRKMKNIKTLAAAMTVGAAVVSTGCDYFLPGNFEMVSYKDYSSDYAGDQLVLNGYISAGHGVFAEVHHSLPPERAEVADSVTDATVELLRDGQTVATLHRNARPRLSADLATRYAYYLLPSEVDIVPGLAYSLRATSPTYGQAESEPETVPQPPAMDSVWAETRHDGRYADFFVRFATAQPRQTACSISRAYRYGLCHAPLFFTGGMATRTSGGERETLRAYSFFRTQAVDSVIVDVMTLSDNTALHLASMADYEDSNDDLAYEYPLAVSQNVSGGYGFVGAYAASWLTMRADSVNATPRWDFDDEEDMDDELDVSPTSRLGFF